MLRLHRVLLGFSLLGGISAYGQFTPIPQPSAGYTGGTTLVAISPPNFTSLGTALTQGGQTLTFSTALEARSVGAGWATWANTPDTEGNANGTRVAVQLTGPTTFTIALSVPASTFGFEFEANSGPSSVTATFLNNATVLGTITQSLPAINANARLVAATSATPITSVSLSIPNGGNGAFAFARFRFSTTVPASVPTASTGALSALAAALLAVGAALARRRQAPV